MHPSKPFSSQMLPLAMLSHQGCFFFTTVNISLNFNMMYLCPNNTANAGMQTKITSYNLLIVDIWKANPFPSHVQVRANRFHQSIGGGWWWLNRLRGWLIRFSGWSYNYFSSKEIRMLKEKKGLLKECCKSLKQSSIVPSRTLSEEGWRSCKARVERGQG